MGGMSLTPWHQLATWYQGGRVEVDKRTSRHSPTAMGLGIASILDGHAI